MNKKKKLLITGSTFPRWEGDTEPRFVLDLAKALLAYYDVTVLVPAALGSKKEEILEGVKVIRYTYFPIEKFQTLCYPGAIVPRIREKKSRVLLVPFLFLSLWFALLRIQKDYDIVHAHWLIPQGIIHSFLRKPYLVTGHGGDVTSLNSGIMKCLKRRCLRKAARITVVSESLKNVLLFEYGIEEKKIDILTMGCNVHQFGRKYRIENFFGQNDRKVVLFVGRLAEKKGLTYLIDAMHQINALLVVVGTGPLELELKKQAEELSGKVVFLGAKTHEELKVIYASADVFAAPSVTAEDGDKEGLGLVILEAMASGLPVVASRSGGIVDLIRNRENGLLVEEKNSAALATAINELLNDDALNHKIRCESESTVKSYDYDVIAEGYREIFERMECGTD